jgi:hypothetical protein
MRKAACIEFLEITEPWREVAQAIADIKKQLAMGMMA